MNKRNILLIKPEPLKRIENHLKHQIRNAFQTKEETDMKEGKTSFLKICFIYYDTEQMMWLEVSLYTSWENQWMKWSKTEERMKNYRPESPPPNTQDIQLLNAPFRSASSVPPPARRFDPPLLWSRLQTDGLNQSKMKKEAEKWDQRRTWDQAGHRRRGTQETWDTSLPPPHRWRRYISRVKRTVNLNHLRLLPQRGKKK